MMFWLLRPRGAPARPHYDAQLHHHHRRRLQQQQPIILSEMWALFYLVSSVLPQTQKETEVLSLKFTSATYIIFCVILWIIQYKFLETTFFFFWTGQMTPSHFWVSLLLLEYLSITS